MAYADKHLPGEALPGKVEYIELAEFDVPGLIRQRTHNERRLSNRANIDSLEVSRLLKRDILKLWRRIKTVRCELVNISFTGIGIKSKELIKIGETVEIALRCPVSQAEQILPVRICNHYREESGNYAYGGKLEHLLDANFRRLIVQQLTQTEIAATPVS